MYAGYVLARRRPRGPPAARQSAQDQRRPEKPQADRVRRPLEPAEQPETHRLRSRLASAPDTRLSLRQHSRIPEGPTLASVPASQGVAGVGSATDAAARLRQQASSLGDEADRRPPTGRGASMTASVGPLYAAGLTPISRTAAPPSSSRARRTSSRRTRAKPRSTTGGRTRWAWRSNVGPTFRLAPIVSNTTTVTSLAPNPDGTVPVVTPAPGGAAAPGGECGERPGPISGEGSA